MAHSITPGSINVIRGVMLRMCEAHFSPPARPPQSAKREEGAPSLANQLLDGLTVRVLKEAYVILVPTGDRESSQAPTAEAVIAARTTSNGTLVELKESEFDGGVPNDYRRTLWFEAGARVACFWTRSRDLFKRVWAEVQEEPSKAVTEHAFLTFHVEQHRHRHGFPHAELSRVNRNKLELLLYAGAYDTEAPTHGTYNGGFLQKALGVQEELHPELTYVIARSDTLSALYVAELVNRMALDVRMKGGEEEAVFGGVRDIVRYAVDGLRHEKLDQDLAHIQVQGKVYKAEPWNEEYYEYAYECARARVPRKLFWVSINMGSSQKWMAAAAEIWDSYGVRHPAANTEGDKPKYKWPNKDAVLRYFDFYEFGFSNEKAQWNMSWKVAQTTIEQQSSSVRGMLGAFLARHAPYQRFVEEVSAHFEKDFEQLKRFHTWYLDLALVVNYHWWKDFKVESDMEWQRLWTYLGWQAGAMDKIGEMLGLHFGDPESVSRYNEVLQENVEQFEELFGKLEKYNKRFEGKTFKRQYGDGMTIEANFEKNELVILRGTDTKPEKLGLVHFLVEVEVETSEVEVPRHKRKGRRKRFKKMKSDVGRTFVPELPFKTIRHWPGFLAGFGDSLSLAIAVKNLGEDWKTKDKMEVVGKLAMNTFQSLDSLGSALHFATRAGKALPWFIEFAGPAGAVIEAYYNVKEGSILLFDAEESAVVKALENGDEVEARCLFVKGWVMVSSISYWLTSAALGVGGAVIAGGGAVAVVAKAGAALGTTMTPLAIGLAAGAILVIGIDLYLHAHSGPENSMVPFQKKLDEAAKAEFGDLLKARYKDSRTADALTEVVKDANPGLGAFAS
jgi:hypothetical protein